jgi:undecaprenyl-diphosphatase
MREIILGLIQGFTEFLPVSSSGHLAIGQHFISGSEHIDQDIMLDILLHFATLLVVLIYYRQDIAIILKITFFYVFGSRFQTHSDIGDRSSTREKGRLEQKMLPLIIVGSIPTGIIGILLKFSDRIENIFSSLPIVGISLLVTGTLLYLSNARAPSNVKQDISYLDAFIIGTVQGIAVLPGISRSGTTISTGILRGIDREIATTFSFLLSIPAILGAVALEGKDISTLAYTPQFLPYIIGMLVAFGSGYIAIATLIQIVRKKKLFWFSFYCWTVGGILLIYSFVKYWV